MNRIFIMMLLALICISMSSLMNNTTSAARSVKKFIVDTDSSAVSWYGEVPEVLSHTGAVGIKEGVVFSSGKQVDSGSVVLDMRSIETNVAGFTDEMKPQYLVAHLCSADFFDVHTYPIARFEIIGAQKNVMTGRLTIKDKTHIETMQIDSLSIKRKDIYLSGRLVFNRQNYDVSWLGAEGFAISDEIKIDFKIFSKKIDYM